MGAALSAGIMPGPGEARKWLSSLLHGPLPDMGARPHHASPPVGPQYRGTMYQNVADAPF